MNYIFLTIALCIAAIIGFISGVYFCFIHDCNPEDDEVTQQELHCFECEIEMPVKEKNGRLYCSNCGLYH